MKESNVGIYLARIVSGIAHPILMPLYAISIIFYNIPYQFKFLIFLIVLTTTIVLPLSILPFLKATKKISDYGLTNRKERSLPLFISSVFYLIGYIILFKLTYFISSIVLGAATVIFLVGLISYSRKISIHSAGIGGLIGVIFFLNWVFKADCVSVFITAILFAGLLGTARLHLKAHTPQQVYCGFLLGLITMSGTMYMMLMM